MIVDEQSVNWFKKSAKEYWQIQDQHMWKLTEGIIDLTDLGIDDMNSRLRKWGLKVVRIKKLSDKDIDDYITDSYSKNAGLYEERK